MHRVCPPQSSRRGLAHPQMPHLSRAYEIGHRSDRILDRHLGIDAMLIVEIDVIHAQTPQRCIARLPHVIRRAVDAKIGTGFRAHVPELGREHYPVATIADRLSNELLVGEGSVHVRCVQQRYSELDRAMNRRDRFAVIMCAVEVAHSHAPESECGYFQAFTAKTSFLHLRYLSTVAMRSFV